MGAAAPPERLVQGLCHALVLDRSISGIRERRYAKAIKYVSLAEDHLHDHFPGYPVMPNSLVIEGLAQTGGLLVCEHNQFTEKVILAKIPKADFFATPGPATPCSTPPRSSTSRRKEQRSRPPATRAATARRGRVRLRPSERQRGAAFSNRKRFSHMMQHAGGVPRSAMPPTAAR